MESAEQGNYDWLKMVVNSKEYTTIFKQYAQKNIEKFKKMRTMVWNQKTKSS